MKSIFLIILILFYLTEATKINNERDEFKAFITKIARSNSDIALSRDKSSKEEGRRYSLETFEKLVRRQQALQKMLQEYEETSKQVEKLKSRVLDAMLFYMVKDGPLVN